MNEDKFDPEQPSRLMVDFPDAFSMNDFVAALKVMGVVFEDCVLCHATSQDFNKKTGGVARRQTAVLVSKQRYETLPNTLTKVHVPRRNK